MRLLLDTHALLWWVQNDQRLTKAARAAIGDPGAETLVSVASAWECGIKVAKGKLPQAAPLVATFKSTIEAEGFTLLPIELEHCLGAAALPRHHGDPFDRMLIAQALREGMVLLSNEEEFDAYGVKRVW